LGKLKIQTLKIVEIYFIGKSIFQECDITQL